MSQLFASGGQSTGVSASLTRLREKGKWVWHPTVGDMVAECFCSEFLFLRWRRYDSETELMKKYPCQTNPQEDFFLFSFLGRFLMTLLPGALILSPFLSCLGCRKSLLTISPLPLFPHEMAKVIFWSKKKKKKIRLHHSPLKSCNYIEDEVQTSTWLHWGPVLFSSQLHTHLLPCFSAPSNPTPPLVFYAWHFSECHSGLHMDVTT